MAKRLPLYERDRLVDDLVDVELDDFPIGFPGELANSPHHPARPIGVTDNSSYGGERLVHVRNLAGQPAQASFAVDDNGAERLIDFMRNRRAHFSERRYARNVGEVRLCRLQCLFRLLDCSDVHQRTNNFLPAGFIVHAMGSDVQMLDHSTRRQKTEFIVVVAFVLSYLLDLLAHTFSVVRMNALEDEVGRRLNRLVDFQYPIHFFRPDDVAAAYPPAKAAGMA